jgi:hypothetical protein
MDMQFSSIFSSTIIWFPQYFSKHLSVFQYIFIIYNFWYHCWYSILLYCEQYQLQIVSVVKGVRLWLYRANWKSWGRNRSGLLHGTIQKLTQKKSWEKENSILGTITVLAKVEPWTIRILFRSVSRGSISSISTEKQVQNNLRNVFSDPA